MLSAVKVDSQQVGIPQLVFKLINRPESDLFVCRNIDGLDPVKADVNTSPLASDGESYNGSKVGKRNIVFTIGFNPDWGDWTLSKLRKELRKYFLPKMRVRLTFETNEMAPVAIWGYVESNEYNMFSKDPENQISVICPQPYFETATPIVITGTTDVDVVTIPGIGTVVYQNGSIVPLEYNGDVETGVHFKVSKNVGPPSTPPTILTVGVIPLANGYFGVEATVDDTTHYEVNSIPGQKYARLVTTATGVVVDNLLDNFWGAANVGWDALILTPDGNHVITVNADHGVQDWELTYTEKFGGL